MENYIVINGKKAELTKEQLEKLGIKIEENIFEPENGDKYYFINNFGELGRYSWANDEWDTKTKGCGNLCMNRDIMQQRAWYEILNRQLWKFSLQHDGDKLKPNHMKFYIFYNEEGNCFEVRSALSTKGMQPYFLNEEVALEAIGTIVVPFMEQHPDFVW